MTPEKEIEIMKWLVDNYPNHETNCVKIWELIKIVNHYHESEVKKLNIPEVIKSLPEYNEILYHAKTLTDDQFREYWNDVQGNVL